MKRAVLVYNLQIAAESIIYYAVLRIDCRDSPRNPRVWSANIAIIISRSIFIRQLT
jgi:hypothetical protein